MSSTLSISLKRSSLRSDEKALPRESNIKLKCGDCLHFKGTANPAVGPLCSTVGIRAGATAPACYTANVNVFRPLGVDTMRTVASLVATFSAQQQRVFMGLLRNAASLDKLNLSFMQTVYFTTGGDCLENWYKGYALSAGPDRGTVMVLGSDALKANRTLCTALLMRATLVTSHREFRKIKEALISKGKLNKLPPKLQKKYSDEEYDPPTLDTNQDALEALAQGPSKKKKKKKPAGQLFLIDHSQGDDEA